MAVTEGWLSVEMVGLGTVKTWETFVLGQGLWLLKRIGRKSLTEDT